MMVLRCSLLVLALLCFPLPSKAADYHVGPGQALASIGEVPWATLMPGDMVFIHWRATPYLEKWVINRPGTANGWITVRGVLGPQGQRPVIDGRGAVTANGLNYWNEERGVIKIGGSNTPPDGMPSYIAIENLEIRSARPPFDFTNDGGGISSYVNNAASIYVEKAQHLVIRNCVLHDSGNGLFIGSFDGQTQDVLIEGNHFYDNGIVDRFFEHNAYTEAVGITYQYNRFSALRAGADGNNLKDRSAGLIVRYNWIEDGNRQLDLVEGGGAVAASPGYDETFVYGNVLIESDGEGNSQIVHYGGDGGDTSLYRKGQLYFYNNTVVSTRTGNTTLMLLSTQDESADVRNNVLYTSAAGNRWAMTVDEGTMTLRNNWSKPDWRISHGTFVGTLDDDGSGITGAAPGFEDEVMQNFRPTAGAPLLDAGTNLNAAAAGQPMLRHYLRHQGSEERPQDADLDIGAYEYCPTSCNLMFGDTFETGDATAWSVISLSPE